jgi:hypothetical protein
MKMLLVLWAPVLVLKPILEADTERNAALADVDGNSEDQRGTVSVFNGPGPEIATFDDPEQESEAVAGWVKGPIEQGVQPHEIGVFLRSSRELRQARSAVKQAGA